MNRDANGIANEIDIETTDGTTDGTTDRTTDGTTTNRTMNGTTNGTSNGTTNGTTNGTMNGTTNGTMNGIMNGIMNGTTNWTANETANGTTNGGAEHSTNNNIDDNKQIHVIIIGAGLTGLLLAQGLRKWNAELESQGRPPKYTYCVYERDESQFFRGGGFSLTIHWGLQYVYEMLPKDLADQIYECVGNKAAMEKGQMGSFTYLNLRTGDPLLRAPVPPDWKGARMNRAKFIKLLMTGLSIEYSKRLSTITFPNDSTVCASFEDGQQVTGDLLVGADGSRSAVRQFLHGADNSKNSQLPIRMINTR
ncbi:MAG: hypothetical protein Q9204_008721, partial [Flavoplaca sp. TL-2023a]